MDGPVYVRACHSPGLTPVVPDRADREVINAITFQELVNGHVTRAFGEALRQIIDKLHPADCDCGALACTELPMLIGRDISSSPTLDSTRVLARAALEVAIGERPMPTWRGGAV